MELSYESPVNDNGKLLKSVSEQIAKGLLNFKGKKVTISLSDEVSRTQRQNRLWWVYVGILSKETGYDKNEMHELLKSKFMPFATSTTELTTVQFSEMVNEVIKWSIETFNVILPDNES